MTKQPIVLSNSFYQHADVQLLARKLLGKYLITNFGSLTGGMIIETEAYQGPEDRASHAFNGRRTKRTEVMFKEGGICYVYLIYGLYCLLNIVTNTKDIPHCILIRAIKPEIGIEEMLKRRHKAKIDKTLAGGPGTLTQALGIDRTCNGQPLNGPFIWIEDRGVIIKNKDIIIGPRTGIDYAGDHAHLPWQYKLRMKDEG